MDDDATMMERMNQSLYGSSDVVKKVIIGYRQTSQVLKPLLIILPKINFDSLSQGKENGFEEAGLALYPKTECFSYDKEGYMASLIGLASESLNTLVFNHAERVDTSKCKKDWENLILNLMAHNPIKISDNVAITRPENDLTVVVCTEKPRCLVGGSIKYCCIDLSDKNLNKKEDIEKYERYRSFGEKWLEEPEFSEKDQNTDKTLEESQNSENNSNTEKPTINKEIDWEERRFQLVKAIVAGKLAGKDIYDVSLNDAHINKIIATANKIIEKLKSK